MRNSLFMLTNERPMFSGHETFTLRHGWLEKGYELVTNAESDLDGESGPFNKDEGIGKLGVGKNMVVSIRHWCLAAGILALEHSSDGRNQHIKPTTFGRVLFGEKFDPYLEHSASLWMVHWNLCSSPGRAALWYWFFSEFHESRFDRDLVLRRAIARIDELKQSGRINGDRAASLVTIKRDIDCLIKTYFGGGYRARVAPEDGFESPLIELGLIKSDIVGDTMSFGVGPKTSLPPEVVLHAVVEFARRFPTGAATYSLNHLTFSPGSPGLVFKLGQEELSEYLLTFEELEPNHFAWDETAGLKQLAIRDLQSIDTFKHFRRRLSDAGNGALK